MKGKLYKDPTKFTERLRLAKTCIADLKISIPTLIDEMDDGAARAYDAMPDRIYIVGTDGRIAYRGEQGPWGFKPGHMETRLRKLLGLPEEGRVLQPEPATDRPDGAKKRRGEGRRRMRR